MAAGKSGSSAGEITFLEGTSVSALDGEKRGCAGKRGPQKPGYSVICAGGVWGAEGRGMSDDGEGVRPGEGLGCEPVRPGGAGGLSREPELVGVLESAR